MTLSSGDGLFERVLDAAAADGSADPQTALRYRQEILERGGSRPALESFVAFRGRKPTVDALLRHSGMATSSAQ